jgi:hypothetical protein
VNLTSRLIEGTPLSILDKECIRYARECVRLAGMAKDEDLREQFLNIARQWMAEAGKNRRRRTPKSMRARWGLRRIVRAPRPGTRSQPPAGL